MTNYPEIIAQVVDDLEDQAGIILTPQQLYTLQQTHQISLKQSELAPYNIAGIKHYLKQIPTKVRYRNCYKNLANGRLVIVIA
ncbi:hypothetical protein ACFQH1_12165 [Lactiplantibacillus daoliensis]|uniref:Uncharacterized protein n=1 Tax=Lactiplantibacillus daoliensis TaxID=2559916 RepID=A0ABW1ULJ2_9LACO|nr:hypothetical protein [Lactiplantibacillus daoliensis]